ncbi:MAG: hypothetical protein WBC99_02870, partial [Candidatus Omnitrophota bacterium]
MEKNILLIITISLLIASGAMAQEDPNIKAASEAEKQTAEDNDKILSTVETVKEGKAEVTEDTAQVTREKHAIEEEKNALHQEGAVSGGEDQEIRDKLTILETKQDT